MHLLSVYHADLLARTRYQADLLARERERQGQGLISQLRSKEREKLTAWLSLLQLSLEDLADKVLLDVVSLAT